MRPGEVVGTCLTVSADGWDGGSARKRDRLRGALTGALQRACLRSGFAPGLESFADGVHLMLREGEDPVSDVPSLVLELGKVLAEANGPPAGAARVRLRMALTLGLILPPGIAGQAVADGVRLLDSEPVRAAARRPGSGHLTVVASHAFYSDVTSGGTPAHRPDDYRRIRLDGPPWTAWLYLPGRRRPRRAERSDGSEVAAAGEAGRLIGATDLLLREERYGHAVRNLEQALRIGSTGGLEEEALLRLGDCRRRQGDVEAAAQAWSYLLVRHPLCWAACRRLGRLELRRGRPRLASVYLAEGVRLLRSRPGPATAPDICALLLDLACVLTVLGDRVAATACVDQAAQADPPSPLPLVWLAYRAAAGRDMQAVRRLLETAFARVPGDQRPDFADEHFRHAGCRKGGDLIIEVLLEDGLIPAAPRRSPDRPRPPPA